MNTDRSVFIRVIRGLLFLDAAEKQENQYDQKDEPDTTAGPISPISAHRAMMGLRQLKGESKLSAGLTP